MKTIFDILRGFSSRIPEPENRVHRNEPPKEPPPVKRHFEFERHPNYPWLPHSGYETVHGDDTIRLSEWGRKYTGKAIDRTQPSSERFGHPGEGYYKRSRGRSIAPEFVENTIAYGNRSVDEDGNITYRLGDVEVGLNEEKNLVYHILYTHGKK